MTATYTPVFERRRAVLPPIDYTMADYHRQMEDYLAVIPTLTDRWTDFNADDLGMVVLRATARGIDGLYYYLDARVQDLYIDTNRLRDTLFAMTRRVGYSPHLAAGGTATMRITLAAPASSGVTLEKWWQASSAGSGTQYFMALLEEATIPAGQTSVDVAAIQAERVTDTFAGTGSAGQIFTLTREKVCAVGLVVDGEEWDEVETTVGQAADAKVYVVRLLWNDTVQIETGDGIEGAIPPAGAEVTVTYLVTLGAAGNEIGAGQITRAVDPILDGVVEVTSTATVTNLESVTGGEDEEADADIKRNAPRCTHALYRTGPANDTQALLEAFPGVERALVLDVNNYSDIVRYHYEEIYIIPAGGGAMSEALAGLLEDFLDERKTPGFEVVLATAEYVPVPVTATVYRYAGYSDAEVEASVREALEDYFSADPDIGTVDWMRDVDPDEIVGVLNRLDGVSYVEMSAPTETVEVAAGQFPTLGALSVTIVEVGE